MLKNGKQNDKNRRSIRSEKHALILNNLITTLVLFFSHHAIPASIIKHLYLENPLCIIEPSPMTNIKIDLNHPHSRRRTNLNIKFHRKHLRKRLSLINNKSIQLHLLTQTQHIFIRNYLCNCFQFVGMLEVVEEILDAGWEF